MAKKPKIVRQVVPLDGKVYSTAEADELEEKLTPAQGQRLLDKGAIEGDWEFGGQEKPENPPEPEPGQLLQATAGFAVSSLGPAEVAASYISGTFGIERESDESAPEFLANFVSEARQAARESKTLQQAFDKQATEFSATLQAEQQARTDAESEVERLKGELEQAKKAAPKSKPKPEADGKPKADTDGKADADSDPEAESE